jgi:5-methylcytosine-specific restriction protein A
MPNSQRKGGRPWQRIRAFVLTRDHGLCQLRYPGLCTKHATEVDHVIQVHHNPTLEYDPTNLRAVCTPCHKHRTALQAAGNDRPPHIEASRTW